MKTGWIELAHGWKFLRDEAPDAWQPKFDDSHWETVSVPHCFNAADSFIPEQRFYRGPGWYRLVLPDLPKGRRIELSALGAFSVTHVWLNGEFLGKYMGGYTGFHVDLTAALKKKRNVLALRVTNQHNPDVLPGNIDLDYNLYGGIYREIGLRITDQLHIDNDGIIVTTPEVSKKSGRVFVNIRLRNDRNRREHAKVAVQIRSPKNHAVSENEVEFAVAAGATRLVNVPLDPVKKPSLWSPDEPNLYTLRVKLKDKDGVIDEQSQDFGFRWFYFNADRGFFLNGEQLKLRGMNRHQDYPGIGNALPASFQAYDVELLKQMGVNFVRCSHYPMHPAFLDACDREGILVYAEIASWQYIGGKQFAANAVQMMEEMIARDRHHPSIILWGLLNEGRDRDLFQLLHDTAKRMDSWRPTVYAENHPEDGKELGTVDVPDVVALNYKVPHLDELRALLPDLKLMNSEHSNANTGERFVKEGAGGNDWHDDELWQTDKILHDLDEFAKREWIAGSALWCMHDYGTEYGVSRPIQMSGCIDAWRFPKLATHAIRARWNDTPFTRILGHWTWPGEDGVEKRIGVASNADRVELVLNGTSLGVKTRADATRMGYYTWVVPYAPGTLHAVGNHSSRSNGGAHLDQTIDEVRTAGEPVGIIVETLHKTLPANGTDITLVTATIVDGDGARCPTADTTVTFDVESAASKEDETPALFGLYGEPKVTTYRGRGRIVLRTGRVAGKVRIRAHAEGLESGEAVMKAR